ncbi:MAG: winged helix-turn-helix transcriptional regulator [Clostridia bacterium]|nr:winged helix-turn-helix transcriptional regulator [Clostridia bacterium]
MVRIDPLSHTVYLDDKPVPLSPAEYRLLADLAPGKLVGYTYLSLDVLGLTTEAKQELEVLVRRLKRKLGVKIERVKGRGYVMRS